MFEHGEPRTRRVPLRDDAPGEDSGWWLVTDATLSGGRDGDSGVLASLAQQRASPPEETPHLGVADERYLTKRVRALLQARLPRTGTSAHPVPAAYLRSLAGVLCGAPREPLVRAIVALRHARLGNGRVFVLTEETRAGLGSRLAADLRRQGIDALLVTQHMPQPVTRANPARMDTLLRPGDVVIALHGSSPAYADIRAAAKDADATFVVFGADQDHAEKGVYTIACGSSDYQALDARLFFTFLICGVLADLDVETQQQRAMHGRRLRQVS